MLIETVVLYIILASAPERCSVGERIFWMTSRGPSLQTVATWSDPGSVFLGADLESALAKDFALIPEVHNVLLERAEENLLVWIASDNPSRQVRERIFQKELDLIGGFPEIEFDFNVVASPSLDAHSLSSNAKLVYSRETEVAK